MSGNHLLSTPKHPDAQFSTAETIFLNIIFLKPQGPLVRAVNIQHTNINIAERVAHAMFNLKTVIKHIHGAN